MEVTEPGITISVSLLLEKAYSPMEVTESGITISVSLLLEGRVTNGGDRVRDNFSQIVARKGKFTNGGDRVRDNNLSEFIA